MYYTIHKFSKLVGKSADTLRRWDKKGILKPHHTSTNGYRYYSDKQIYQVLKTPKKNRIVVGYCRVSSKKQSDDLKRQVNNMSTYLTMQGKPFEIITDIGSGINYEKPGLQSLLERLSRGEIEKVVILYKDCLVRFGFELINQIAKMNGTIIEVVDQSKKTEEQELIEDLIQIVTVFSCKLQSKKANKIKKILRELKTDD